MYRILFIFICFMIVLPAHSIAKEKGQFAAGIVYGTNAAFKIDAPEKWVLDNSSGVSQGLHCVLYPEGATWADSPVVMYAKIASPKYSLKTEFIKFALKSFKKNDPAFTYKKIMNGKTKQGFEYTINEYIRPGGRRPHFERVAYVQLPKAVAYIVFSSSEKDAYEKNTSRIMEVMDSFKYQPGFIKQ